MRVEVTGIRKETLSSAATPGTPMVNVVRLYADISAVTEDGPLTPGVGAKFSIEIDDPTEYTVGEVYNLKLTKVTA